MKCPHCLTAFHERRTDHALGEDIDGMWMILRNACPECKRSIFELARCYHITPQSPHLRIAETRLVYPKVSARSPASKEVPPKYAIDYGEACLVILDSPKASAALSRRCLQHLLREVAKVKPSDLSEEIQQVIDSGKLPTHIAESIDAVRNVGNFAAHPNKNKHTGEIVDVEPNEAEWSLAVLESLFDFYFVQPATTKAKRDALNQKLKDSGKPPLK